MDSEYVKQDEHGAMRVGNTHVMLDSVIAAYREGHSAETIQTQYPALTLEQVYGAIACASGIRREVGDYLQRQEAVWDQSRHRSDDNPSPVVREASPAAPGRSGASAMKPATISGKFENGGHADLPGMAPR